MRSPLLAAALLALTACAALAQTQVEAPRAPVIVELYTSQGCWQCPRANRLLGQIASEPGVLALTFAVAYWDYLGWPDTFAQPDFTDRQRAYSRALRARGLLTPQLVFNGERQNSASDWDEAWALLREVQAEPRHAGAPTIAITRQSDERALSVTISGGALAGEQADVWALGVDPGPVTILATRGENAHRRITHYNLVRSIDRAGLWRGEAMTFERRLCRPECVILVQMPNGGPILAGAYTYVREAE